MAEKVVPMIHVPDVSATVDWYRDIGFTVIDTFSDDGEGLRNGSMREKLDADSIDAKTRT